jgi:hypothetical protein
MRQDEQELRERKTDALLSLVSAKCEDVNGSNEKRQSFLNFFARIANRWSAPNAVAIYGQRPDIQNPITIEQAKQLGHTVKPGTRAISILEPLAIDEKMARQNSYLMFRKWAIKRGVTEQELLQLCKKRVERCLHDELDVRSPKGQFRLRQMVFESHPDWDRESAQRLCEYARQYLDKEGAFDPAEVKRGQDLYQWKARTSVVDLGVDTFGPKIQTEAGTQEVLTQRSTAALLRFMESKRIPIDYEQVSKVGPEEKLRSLLYIAAGTLRNQRGLKFHLTPAVFCICSQLGISQKFDLSSSEGWGKKPGEFMSNLSAIRKIQKEITTGMQREMKVIASLESELAQTEARAEELRAKLSGMGAQTTKQGAAQRAERHQAQPPVPIIKDGQVRPSTIDGLGYEGLYFKIGKRGFLNHQEAAEFLAASHFVDSHGEELSVQIKRRDDTGAKEILCVMPATQFAKEVISHSEPTFITALGAAVLEEEPRESQHLATEAEETEASQDPEETKIRV